MKVCKDPGRRKKNSEERKVGKKREGKRKSKKW